MIAENLRSPSPQSGLSKIRTRIARRKLRRKYFAEDYAENISPKKSITAFTVQVGDVGLAVEDIATDTDFLARPLHTRDIVKQLAATHRITHAFMERPQTVLQQLVNTALDLCDADCAGISVACDEPVDDDGFYEWIATAGSDCSLLQAILPCWPRSFGPSTDRHVPQHFTLTTGAVGDSDPALSDGLLFPWFTETSHGTVVILALGRPNVFDMDDRATLELLADFAAMAVRNLHVQQLKQDRASAVAADAMAHSLAHRINNPLQSVTNAIFLASTESPDASRYARLASVDLARLSALVQELLAISRLPTSQKD